MPSPSDNPPPTLLGGKIRLLRRIGRGGMGDVWIARNEATQAEVAVKTLQKAERSALHDERFRREARLAATISHRNVVRIFDLVDEPDGTLGLVMELLRGGTLDECLRERGPLSTVQSVAVASSILTALNHVHRKGILHRDVKPANIFFAVEPDGHVVPKILDFGIAKLHGVSSALTVDGSVLGTPHYMAPEQIRGVIEIDGRSDMFAFASVLCEMLTGVRPFERDSAVASLAAVLEHEVVPDPRIEPAVWSAISRALGKGPDERFATCSEFADALRAAVGVGDDDFATALQELRPRNEAIPDGEPTALGGLPFSTASSASTSTPAFTSTSTPTSLIPRSERTGRSRRRRPNVAWTLGAAMFVALFAVTVMLAIPGSGTAPPRAGEGPTLGAATPVSAGERGPGSSPPAAVPLPLETGAAPVSSIGGPVGAASRPVPRPRPMQSPSRAIAPTPKPAAPKPVATSPGF